MRVHNIIIIICMSSPLLHMLCTNIFLKVMIQLSLIAKVLVKHSVGHLNLDNYTLIMY